MKTIEEIRSAVLAYCEEVCPNRDSPRVTDWGDFVFGYVNDGGKEYEAWFLHIGNFNRPIPLYALTDAKTWIAAYRLLGLETRDAVEAYKASLQSDLKSMTSIVASVKNGEQPDYVHISKITELQARNTALVEALEVLANHISNTQFMYKLYLESKDGTNSFNLSKSIGELGRAKTKCKKEFLDVSSTEQGDQSND